MGFWRFLVLQSSFTFILELPGKKRVLVLRVAGASKILEMLCQWHVQEWKENIYAFCPFRKPSIGNWVCYTVICEVNYFTPKG